MDRPAIFVFDAYGTLFDVAAAARRLAADARFPMLAESWLGIAESWRLKQLQYSWIRALAGRHADFRQVTAEALDWTLEAHGLAGTPGLADELMALYDRLDAYPAVPDMLAALRAKGVKTAILSNGSPAMLESACRSAGIADLLDGVLSVEEVGIFKPAPAVYGLVETHFAVPPARTAFVSANGWDAAAGAGFGFRSIWVNRRGEPVDRLPWKPETVLDDLSSVPQLAG